MYLSYSLCFFFKQKTAYALRISDWSSDVCSSDLNGGGHGPCCCPFRRRLAPRRAALTVLLNQVAPEDLAALERVAETTATALREDALSTCTTCRFFR